MHPNRSDTAHKPGRDAKVRPALRSRRILNILVHSVGLVAFVVLVAYFWPGIRKAWAHLHWGLFAWSCALFPILMAFKVERFRLLTREAVGALSYRYAYLVYFATYFIGVITPGRVGEFAKVHYLMKDKGVSASRALRPVLMDRLFDLLCLAAVGSVGWAVVGIQRIEGMTPLKVGGFVLLGVLFLTGPLWGRLPVRAMARSTAFGGRLGQLMGWLDDTLASFYTRVGGLSALLTAVAYAIGFYQALVIARSVGIDEIGYLSMCVIMAAISLAMLLPISVSGFGTREAAAILLMGQMYDIPKDQAISFSLLYFVVFNGVGGLIGFVCWLLMPLVRGKGSKESLTQLKAELDEID